MATSRRREADVLHLGPKLRSDSDPVIDDELLARTIDIWQPLSPTPLTREDARQIVENLTRYCHVLWESSPRRRLRYRHEHELDQAA